MSERYIKASFSDIKRYADVIEKRVDDRYFSMEEAIKDNAEVLKKAISMI